MHDTVLFCKLDEDLHLCTVAYLRCFIIIEPMKKVTVVFRPLNKLLTQLS